MEKQQDVSKHKADAPELIAKPTPPKTKVIHLGNKKHRMKNVVVLRDDEDRDLR